MQTLWIALSLTDHVGTKTLRALIDHFGDDPQAILNASSRALQAVPGIGPKIARSIQQTDLKQVEQALQQWQQAGVTISTVACAGYPPNLLSIDDPPATLFLSGTWQAAYDRAAAVIGTRNPSPLAEDLAIEIGKRLAQYNITVVSGLAAGVDSLAHRGALLVPDGRTVAVLGSGVLNIYPRQNRTLAAQCSLVMSEVAPPASPSSPRLVARNRIISGLSQAVIVVETSVDGGAMHAARRAFEQGRVVFTFGLSATGNQALIESGAQALHPDLSNFDLVLDQLLEE